MLALLFLLHCFSSLYWHCLLVLFCCWCCCYCCDGFHASCLLFLLLGTIAAVKIPVVVQVVFVKVLVIVVVGHVGATVIVVVAVAVGGGGFCEYCHDFS